MRLIRKIIVVLSILVIAISKAFLCQSNFTSLLDEIYTNPGRDYLYHNLFQPSVLQHYSAPATIQLVAIGQTGVQADFHWNELVLPPLVSSTPVLTVKQAYPQQSDVLSTRTLPGIFFRGPPLT
ncbi:hypothetical protein [Chitinophaga sancti]|uniref:Uncharacterized protein n=1 Tax=Chitinophaga sancti TaxID=1004 RepID=A0A1K1SM00_9BACT|nr:hypothetical protein [Chitinophaga sancti]WQD63902.1 hypothetical protein U0033_05800 [Chitinophaga sancti]WQG90473.1 hypothetical protein SR876_03120 [Chitinophaga sancti]SFW85345.1 hypothetical protein SAMN05661012_05715 [Chitinophaga sancti]